MAEPVTADVADRIADPWGARTPYARGERWPERVDMHLTAGHDAQLAGVGHDAGVRRQL